MVTETAIKMTEKKFRQQVLDLCRTLGWKAYFTWSSIHSPSGFPDLVICKPPKMLFVELKSENGKLTAMQESWLRALSDCGQMACVWRPSQWDDIVRILGGGAEGGR